MSKALTVFPNLLSLDITETVKFYTNKLGFMCRFKNDRFAILNKDDIEIQFTKCHDPYVIAWSSFSIQVSDVDALHSEYSGKNFVHSNGKIKDTAYGTREFSLIDPYGICITFFEKLIEPK